MKRKSEPNVPDYKEIYGTRARDFERLVSREDYQAHLLDTLNQVRPLAGIDVVELGAGTGRLTSMMAPLVRTIVACDISHHMLDVAVRKLEGTGLQNWILGVADNRALPIADRVADLSIVGWSLGHFTSWYAETWRDEIGRALAQMKRVLRPGGTVVILETLGTGAERPSPPTDALTAYYTWLQDGHGFSSTWFRTDYRFASLNEAEELTRFFFGDALADRVVEENLVVLPECTGLWWLRV
jgi:ubiquinone/menaquinone biosynthesis C-methylase UbiE